MNDERKKLLDAALAVGLILGTDFQKNISNDNLQKLIDNKKDELAAMAKGTDTEQTDEQLANSDGPATLTKVVIENNSEDTEQTDEQTETYEDEMKIKRTSPCSNYTTTIIGLKEAARRSNLTVDEVKVCLESGEAAPNGWIFTEK